MSTERRICFVIMPFSKTTEERTETYWTGHFESFLKPLIEENPELEARRSQALRGDILRQIITDLVVSPIVVADLTDHNPNVYWELGLRQSFKHGTVTVAEASTTLPFDIGAKGTLFYYPKNHLKYQEFRMRFKEAIQDCLVNPDRPDSHVLETLSGRGTLFEIFQRDEAIRRLEGLLSECDNNLVQLERAFEIAEKNQKEPSKRVYPTYRLGVAALELLVTNHYIDEAQSFFRLAERCLNDLTMINGQLAIWEYRPNSTEPYLIKDVKLVSKNAENFKAKVKTCYDKLKKQF